MGALLETTKGLRRPSVRADEVPPLPGTARTAPDRDPLTKRFVPKNKAAAGRAVKKAAREQRLLGLDPTKVASWVRPYVTHAQTYAAQLASAVPQTPSLGALAGDAATAETVYRALLSAATSGEPIDRDLLKEARGWLREHRQCLVVLAALAGETKPEAAANLFYETAKRLEADE